jgi:hypothetical protein
MKYALNDSMVERANGRTVEGGDRTEVTELWTFMRRWRQLAALSHPADLMLPSAARPTLIRDAA